MSDKYYKPLYSKDKKQTAILIHVNGKCQNHGQIKGLDH